MHKYPHTDSLINYLLNDGEETAEGVREILEKSRDRWQGFDEFSRTRSQLEHLFAHDLADAVEEILDEWLLLPTVAENGLCFSVLRSLHDMRECYTEGVDWFKVAERLLAENSDMF